MATLAKNAPRKFGSLAMIGHILMIAAEIIFQGAAVGIVAATGYGRPLAGGDRFVGFAVDKADNTNGSAGDLNVEVRTRGSIELAVLGAVLTDIGQPVYATDDDTFVFLPVGGTFVGFVTRFVSAGFVEVEFDVDGFADPYGGGVYEEIAGAKVLDALDSGKTMFVSATSVVTLPVTATQLDVKLVNIGPFGTVQTSIDPAAADAINSPDSAGTANKDRINTLATAQRGDLAHVRNGHADGAVVVLQIGTWADEA